MTHERFGAIYKIQCLGNGKIYIGQTIIRPFQRRFRAHLYKLRKNNHANPYLQNTYNKYGEESFTFELIDFGDSEAELNALERLHINRYESINADSGFNLREGGSRGKHLTKTINKMRNSRKGSGVFKTTGSSYLYKQVKPWKRVWLCQIRYKGRLQSLGYYESPFVAETVFNLVQNEIEGPF